MRLDCCRARGCFEFRGWLQGHSLLQGMAAVCSLRMVGISFLLWTLGRTAVVTKPLARSGMDWHHEKSHHMEHLCVWDQRAIHSLCTRLC